MNFSFIYMEPLLIFLISIFLTGLFYLTGRCVSIFCAILSYCLFIFLILLYNPDEFIIFIFVVIPNFSLLSYVWSSIFINNFRDHICLDILLVFLFVLFLLILDMSLAASAQTISFFVKSGGFGALIFKYVCVFQWNYDKASLFFLCGYFLKESVFGLLVAGSLSCFVISFIFLFCKLLFRLLGIFVRYLRKKDGGV